MGRCKCGLKGDCDCCKEQERNNQEGTRRKAQIQRIKDRYFRKVIAYPKGAIVHYGDCSIYSIQICNCGLLADLNWLPDGLAVQLYPNFWKDREKQQPAINALEDLIHNDKLKPLPKPTKAEKKKMNKMLNELFGKKIYERPTQSKRCSSERNY